MRRRGRQASPCLVATPFKPTRMSDRFQATIAQLWVYPIKSCAGVSLTQAELTDDGLLFDRSWPVPRPTTKTGWATPCKPTAWTRSKTAPSPSA